MMFMKSVVKKAKETFPIIWYTNISPSDMSLYIKIINTVFASL